MEFNQMAKDLFTEAELAEIQAEADRLAEEMMKEELKKELIKQATAQSLATKKAKLKIATTQVQSPSIPVIDDNIAVDTKYDVEAQRTIRELQEENKKLRAEAEKYRAALASKGFKIGIEDKVISSDARKILENLGVGAEDIEGIISRLFGDEQYDEIKEIASQYLADKYATEETVIEDKNQIVDFTSVEASF